jgi:hypothetical protein
MALAVAMALFDQIDLDVAELGALPQVILAHQTVEIDRCGSSGISLVVAHLGHALDYMRQLIQQARRGLDGRTLRELGDYLELRLIVEGKHLEHHELCYH